MSFPNVTEAQEYTLKVLCDDTKTVYVDGVEMDVSKSQGWNKMSTSQIPVTTKVIAIKCYNIVGEAGIKVQVEDKTGNVILKSDNKWKCSEQEQTGWKVESFEEDLSWKPALYSTNHPGRGLWSTGLVKYSLTGEVIWTSTVPNAAETAYCRSLLPPGNKYCLENCQVGYITANYA